MRDMAAKADVILEPFRPEVMEKLGLGPNDLMTPDNPGLIYARQVALKLMQGILYVPYCL